ncbi:WXG100 family type VII secretion target [Ruania halotolerans]|uniref:WXG100 family type VII secretion target n=1 Tax=Ruania halotolerans TaxID=2897773 RepID=UPI001E5A2493|nr:WXG100 family type VII secretion target [Ruania halotolerans]UFU07224.1 WXG100 family type VII secretion target [Ruania halotolerans]
MARFEVDSAEVARAGANARNSAVVIQTEVTNMMRHLTALQSSWRGGASTAFTGLLTDWRATQQQVESSLEQISMALDAGAREYEGAESNTMRMFAR